MLTITDVQHRGSEKLPVVLPSGERIDEKIATHLAVLTIYLDIETECSTLFDNVLTFGEDGTPHLDVKDACQTKFVDLGIRAVFDSRGWTHDVKVG